MTAAHSDQGEAPQTEQEKALAEAQEQIKPLQKAFWHAVLAYLSTSILKKEFKPGDSEHDIIFAIKETPKSERSKYATAPLLHQIEEHMKEILDKKYYNLSDVFQFEAIQLVYDGYKDRECSKPIRTHIKNPLKHDDDEAKSTPEPSPEQLEQLKALEPLLSKLLEAKSRIEELQDQVQSEKYGAYTKKYKEEQELQQAAEQKRRAEEDAAFKKHQERQAQEEHQKKLQEEAERKIFEQIGNYILDGITTIDPRTKLMRPHHFELMEQVLREGTLGKHADEINKIIEQRKEAGLLLFEYFEIPKLEKDQKFPPGIRCLLAAEIAGDKVKELDTPTPSKASRLFGRLKEALKTSTTEEKGQSASKKKDEKSYYAIYRLVYESFKNASLKKDDTILAANILQQLENEKEGFPKLKKDAKKPSKSTSSPAHTGQFKPRPMITLSTGAEDKKSRLTRSGEDDT